MGQSSSIEWTNDTWNPWQGCLKVSSGCKNCYMYRDKKRYGQDPAVVVRSKPPTFNAPLTKLKGPLIFTCSWSDFFIDQADPWRDEAWDIIRKTPHLTYQILTKRPENVKDRLPEDWGSGWSNVWLGTSAENQATADQRIPHLLQIPAAVRFLSCEPLLGPIDLDGYYGIDWVIVGGESGPNARPMHPDWARWLRDQCQAAGVAYHFKQWGRFAPVSLSVSVGAKVRHFDGNGVNVPEKPFNQIPGGFAMWELGKARAGRVLDGRTWDEFPQVGEVAR